LLYGRRSASRRTFIHSRRIIKSYDYAHKNLLKNRKSKNEYARPATIAEKRRTADMTANIN